MALTAWDPDGDGPDPEVLVAGGIFARAGGVTVYHVAFWNGIMWSPFGEGLGGKFGYVKALAVFRGELIAAGQFSGEIARWNGSTWESFPGGPNDNVNALYVLNDNLYIGGRFRSGGAMGTRYVTMWDGTSFHSLDGGMNEEVQSLGEFDGDLIAAGNFNLAGGQGVRGIARWDGQAWHPLGQGLYRATRALALFNNDLIAADAISSVEAGHISRWDGQSWESLSGTFDDRVLAIRQFDGDKLFAGGNFLSVDDQVVNCITQWDGQSWQPVGGGFISDDTFAPSVAAMTTWRGDLIAGGWFTHVGEERTSYWARWGCPPCPADFNNDGIANILDFLAFLNAYSAADPSADFNDDGVINILDFLAFLNAYNEGC